MADAAFDPRSAARSGFIRDMWQKYGLIVVGNVVFFALLYFLQYRPNSRENRATELLMLAQQQEAENKLEAAEVLYAKIQASYSDCEAVATANQRLPKVQALAKQRREMQPVLPEACASRIDIKELLEQRPSFYLAELVAGYYPEVKQAERERYYQLLDGYMWLAMARDGVPLAKLRASPAFKVEEMRQRYFAIKAGARFVEDVYWDDFKVKNRNYFPWHNAVIDLTVKQGDSSEQASVRVPLLAPDQEIDVLEFNVASDGGSIEVSGTIVADEGRATFAQRL
jgi:hypothetical protein